MTEKTAYFRGPLSSFSTQLAVQLLRNGWNLHIPAKSALNFSLSPLDLRSSIQSALENAVGKKGRNRELLDRVKLLEPQEIAKGTKYDVIVFCGLPANFDESRVSRAPWAAEELPEVCKRLKDVPVVIVSSLWSAIQDDGVVPEEIEFVRRKPLSHFEGVCQQYELKLLKALEAQENIWYLLRLPMITGNTTDGAASNFSGMANLFAKVRPTTPTDKVLRVNYNPDATFWMLPADVAANLTATVIEDTARPRICNLVSTNATLNQEWMQHLARAAEFEQVEQTDKDAVVLPSTLQSMLKDNVQVKTRNLFELTGRHQVSPVALDREYFQKVLNHGKTANWGLHKTEHYQTLFSEELAQRYFTEFLPERAEEKAVKRVGGFPNGLGFEIEGVPNCSWLARTVDEKLEVKPCDAATAAAASVKFTFSAGGFVRLIKHEMLFEQALLTRDLQAHGKGIELIRACDLLRSVLKDYSFEFTNGTNSSVSESKPQVLQKAGKE